MEITSKMVKELRERTSAGMMDCKKALVETGGDFDAAVKFLREKGLASAAKRPTTCAGRSSVKSMRELFSPSIGVIISF